MIVLRLTRRNQTIFVEFAVYILPCRESYFRISFQSFNLPEGFPLLNALLRRILAVLRLLAFPLTLMLIFEPRLDFWTQFQFVLYSRRGYEQTQF